MSKFKFRLDRVLSWYRTQAALREQTMQTLIRRREKLLAALRQLDEQWTSTHAGLLKSSVVSGHDLRSWSAFQIRLANDVTQTQAFLQDCLQQIASQRQALLEAKRKVEMLERLEAQSRQAWQARADACEQLLAEENYMYRRQARKAADAAKMLESV